MAAPKNADESSPASKTGAPSTGAPSKGASAAKYRRVLLKIAGDVKAGIDLGVEVCLVIGGGNIFRGLSGAAAGIERASADYMGMLATVMNSLAMQSALERLGVAT